MKRLSLLLLCCLTTWGALAQGTTTSVPVFEDSGVEDLGPKVFVLVGLFLLCNFVLAAVKLVLNYLLQKQILTTAPPDTTVERLLPGPKAEQNKVVKWGILLLTTGTGLAICSRYLPMGLHSVIILLFSTAVGFLAYYLFLRRQTK